MKRVNKFMKANAFIITLSVLSPFILSPIVRAADEDSIAATVKMTNLSVTITNDTISYGTISASSTEDTTSGGVGGTPEITNSGNVAETFRVQGYDTTAWDLVSTISGADEYTHKTCYADCDTTPSWAAIPAAIADGGSGYTNLVTNVPASPTEGSTVYVDFQIGTPGTSTSYTTQTANVDIQAVEYIP